MSNPVLVRAYDVPANDSTRDLHKLQSTTTIETAALPPISSFAFSDILREAQCPQLRQAIDEIAHIYAKNRLSLADEYASHLPPLGEVGIGSTVRPRFSRPSLKPALTSVPEGSSGSSEASSRKSKGRRRELFRFGWKSARVGDQKAIRGLRIGPMGSLPPVQAIAARLETPLTLRGCVAKGETQAADARNAVSSLRRILALYG